MPESKKGYSTTTYRFKLYAKRRDWLLETREFYNRVLAFYYHVLLEQKQLLELSNQGALRQLEIMTISQPGREASVPIPYDKVPLYFRRAAINAAVSMARSYEGSRRKWEETGKGKEPRPAAVFHASPLYYKGMYKEFHENSILLKLWTGKSWSWVKYRFDRIGYTMVEGQKRLSPSIKIEKKQIMLHVPVMAPVYDTRSVPERMKSEESVCSVIFPKNDNFAVCTVYDSDGKNSAPYFIKGGRELKNRRKRLLGKIQRTKDYLGEAYQEEKDGRRYNVRLNNLLDAYAHLVSRRIVNYCVRQKAKIIVVPYYETLLDYTGFQYKSRNDFIWMARRIMSFLRYKAFQAGIVVTGVRPHYVAVRCSSCQSPIRKYNTGHAENIHYFGGKQFICPNGHRGNASLNAARNLNQLFQNKYRLKECI